MEDTPLFDISNTTDCVCVHSDAEQCEEFSNYKVIEDEQSN